MSLFENLSLQELLDKKIFLLNTRHAIETRDQLSLSNNAERYYNEISMLSSVENLDKDFDVIISLFDDEIKNRVQHMSSDELSIYHEELYIKKNEIVDKLINDSYEREEFYYLFSEGQCYVDLDREILSAISSKNKRKKHSL